MRHGVAGRAFSRTSSHRKAMLANAVTSLFRHERIRTTVPKAKEARKIAEKVISLGKKGTLHARRIANTTVRDGEVLKKIFGALAERYAKRPGGYTRIVRIGRRSGDAAEMAYLELVDRAESVEAEEPAGEASADKKEPAKKK